ncbi:uncharacterized protein LOC142182195 [Nicotiana tabacum]|uniref:Uncharacterized protein LOC142182195 n=1 Tax=Nicotiana tabacum TaxID=4097 RepID=A0AC58UT51_TOBAC
MCYECNKPGHKKKDCSILKRKKSRGNQGASKDNFVAMISEINVIENDNSWWIDTGATKYVCSDRSFFKSLTSVDDGTVLYMGNSSTVEVKGMGQVKLKFTSVKMLILNDVFYVPSVRKVLVFGSLLNKHGFKQVFEANKFILSKGGVFVGQGYYANSMFKLNVIINNDNAMNDEVSIYIIDSNFSLWHSHLGHVNFHRMKDMSKCGLIPVMIVDSEKYFIGYAENSKAYRFLVIEPNDSYSVNTVIESRDAIFDETRFVSIPRSKDIVLDDPSSSTSQSSIFQNDENQDDIVEVRRSKRVRKEKTYGDDFYIYLVEGSIDKTGNKIPYCYNMKNDPTTFNEAMQSPDAPLWKEAIQDEIDSIMENNTWILTDLPPGCKPIDGKWLFKKKLKVDGTVDKYKARFVVRGFTQKHDIDYFETYAPMARIVTIRVAYCTGLHLQSSNSPNGYQNSIFEW